MGFWSGDAHICDNDFELQARHNEKDINVGFVLVSESNSFILLSDEIFMEYFKEGGELKIATKDGCGDRTYSTLSISSFPLGEFTDITSN